MRSPCRAGSVTPSCARIRTSSCSCRRKRACSRRAPRRGQVEVRLPGRQLLDGDDAGTLTQRHSVDDHRSTPCRVVCARVNSKPITAQRRQPFDIAVAVSGTLYVVLKDHKSGYIWRRIVRSLPMLGDVRIVVMPSSKFRESILNPERTLLAVSLCADFLIADGLFHIHARVRRLACTYTGMHALT